MNRVPLIARITIAYVAGLTAGYVFLVPTAAIWILPLLGATWFMLLGTRYQIAFAAIGVALGALAARSEQASCDSRWADETEERQAAWILIHDPPNARGLASGEVLKTPSGCRGTIRLRFSGEMIPGGALAIVAGKFRHGVLLVRRVRILDPRHSLIYSIRHVISARISERYGSRSGVVQALVLGNKAGIPPDIRADFVGAGIAHILAISGLHVGIIAAWIAFAARMAGAAKTHWLWGAAGTWIYTALLAFPAPATRATAFITIHAISRLRQRHPAWQAVIALAVLLLITIDPAVVHSVGAWLSLAAVMGTTAAQRLIRGRRSAALKLSAASLGATIATAPITAWAFGPVAPIGVLTNLIVIPLAALAVPAVFLGMISETFASAAGVVLSLIERSAAVAAHVPGGHLAGEGGWRFAFPWIAALGATLWVTRGRPKWTVARLRILGIFAVFIWGSFAAQAWWGRDARPGLYIHVLDVGQGDSIAIETPRGSWILVDGGPRVRGYDAGRAVVLPFLRSHGVSSLAVVLVSHGDADHLGGVLSVVSELDPEFVAESGHPVGSALYLEHLGSLAAQGTRWLALRSGDTIVVDSVTLAVTHPSESRVGSLDPNENSLVVHLAYGSFSALLTGDIGEMTEMELLSLDLRSDVLKVAHHGSRTGTSEAFLELVDPRAAVISVGRGNSYGHPSPEVLDRLIARGIDVYRTDLDGTVTIWTNGRYFDIRRERSRILRVRLECLVRVLSRSTNSSSSSSRCSRGLPVRSQTFSTTSR